MGTYAITYKLLRLPTSTAQIFLEVIYLDGCSFTLLDCKGVTESNIAEIDPVLQLCVEKGVVPGCPFSIKDARIDPQYKMQSMVLVVSSDHLDSASFAKTISKLTEKMKNGDRRPILVLTKKDLLNDEELQRNKILLQENGHSDFVYCVANYVCPPSQDYAIYCPVRRLDTELSVLVILESLFF